MTFLFLAGSFITSQKDIRNNPMWIGRVYTDSAALLVTIQEPLVEKTKTYKALARIDAILIGNNWKPVQGNLLLYFKKDSLAPTLSYGSQIVFVKPLQPIKNSGNPGSFDYQRYSAFHDIYHQCYLQTADYKNTGTFAANGFQQWLYNIRFWVIKTLRKYIKTQREQSVAEALLIGYRDDLDKNLVQAYSNTGVVHIIAISGLHLGMIYGMLIWIFVLFKKQKWVTWMKPITVLLVLWIFSLVAGAAPSIVRSAVMFSFLLAGEVMSKKYSIYNTMAASAMVMLIVNPFALWDVGFQLSYAAVLSIVVFMQPVYKWFYIKNKILNGIWKLNSVTLSAQILTIPIVCYHFHQFPNLFLLTNFVVVPLASFVLYGELALIALAPVSQSVAGLAGWVTEKLIWFMNTFITKINDLPFAVTEGIQFSILQTIFLFASIIATSLWLLYKSKPWFFTGFSFSLLFVLAVSFDFYKKSVQSRLIVYNIPQHTAIDFINGRDYQFAGDTVLLIDDFLRNFHLKPSRILHRSTPGIISEASAATPFYFFKNKQILLVDKPYRFASPKKIPVDVIILSKNAKVDIGQLDNAFSFPLIVFDGSNSVWKMNQWKKECDSLHLRHYSTQEDGAFILDL